MFLKLESGTILYRGINDLNNIELKGPLWLALDKKQHYYIVIII